MSSIIVEVPEYQLNLLLLALQLLVHHLDSELHVQVSTSISFVLLVRVIVMVVHLLPELHVTGLT